ncbi:hypothetical protein K3495_g17415, partial [Podosphaera aphanis]
DIESRHIPISEELQTEQSLSQENTIRQISQRIASRAGEVSADLTEENILPESSRRPRKAPRRDLYPLAGNYEAFFTAITATVTDPELIGRKLPFISTLRPPPNTWKQMVRHSESADFIKAAELAWKTLISKDTFDIIPSKDANKLEREHEIKSLPLKW